MRLLNPKLSKSVELVWLCFFYLDLLQNDAIVKSRCMHYIFFEGESLNSTMSVSYL